MKASRSTTWDDVSAHARDHESTWDLDPGAAGSNWGIHRADPPPYNRLLGPVHPRGPACGLVAVGNTIVHHWGDIDRADLTFSIAKTYLAMLAGIAHRDGLLVDVDQPLVRSVPGIGFDQGTNRQVTWRHLLQQTSEWEGSCFGVPDQVDRYRRVSFQPIDRGESGTKGTARPLRPPGEFWEYNDVRINQLSLALLHRFREPLPEVFSRALAGPAGCSPEWRWHGYDNSWIELDGRRMHSVPGGSHWGGGVSIGARDQWRIARLLMGARPDVLPDDWVRAMRTPVALAPFYGYLTWLNGNRQIVPSASPAAFFAIGAGSSVIWHEPTRDLVAVIRWIEADAVDGLVSLIGKALDGQ